MNDATQAADTLRHDNVTPVENTLDYMAELFTSGPCMPLSTAISIAISATRVFPLPTSPCTSLFIWRPLKRSERISFTTRFCAPVSSNGRHSV